MKSIKLQTEILLKPEENQIDYSSKILLMGSCFSENIGAKFSFFKFQNIQNPFGVIFNPISIEKLVIRAIENNVFTENDIFQHDEIWKCFEVHSQLSSLDKAEFLTNLNSALQNLREALFSSSHIIFTFGTSWVYRNLESGEIVANCHKLPHGNFKKELLSIQEISRSFKNIMGKISKINPSAIVINTVSPVRHIKDGFVENSLGKAHLISAIHDFLNKRYFYFPSYEIMMDELRDYRFYSEDMLHPNSTAVEIIWKKFLHVWISYSTKSIQKEVGEIQSALQHRPFNLNSRENVRFQEKLQNRMLLLCKDFPQIKFTNNTIL